MWATVPRPTFFASSRAAVITSGVSSFQPKNLIPSTPFFDAHCTQARALAGPSMRPPDQPEPRV